MHIIYYYIIFYLHIRCIFGTSDDEKTKPVYYLFIIPPCVSFIERVRGRLVPETWLYRKCVGKRDACANNNRSYIIMWYVYDIVYLRMSIIWTSALVNSDVKSYWFFYMTCIIDAHDVTVNWAVDMW